MGEASEGDGNESLARARAWFATQGFSPFRFQEEVWSAYARGSSGLVHAPTGMGKTYAAALPPMLSGAAGAPDAPPPLALLWITPLRALAGDTGLALARAAAGLAPNWTVDVRTGDTGTAARARQGKRLPTALVTTPESLTLFLARSDWRERFGELTAIVVDEWHELMGTKRGVQTELALARLRGLRPALRIWGLSATLANLDDALACLVGPCRRRPRIDRQGPRREGDRRRQPAAEGDRALPLGRPHRIEAAAAGGPCDRARKIHARLHQRPVAGRDLVPGDPRGPPPLGGDDRAASRIARARGARVGRGRAAPRAAARGRLHVEPRPRRRFCAGRPGPADRQPERRGPSAAARRTQRPPTWRRLARAHRSDAGARARRGRGGARGCRHARDRGALAACGAARHAGPARRHLRARRRLHAGRALGRDQGDAGVRAPHRRRVAVHARLRPPWRRQPQRVSRVPSGRDRRRRRRARAGRADRPPAPDRHRHDRVRGVDHGPLPERAGAGPRRGGIHRPPRAGRCLRLRGPHARVRARARAHRVGEAGEGEGSARSALVGRPDGAVDASSPRRRAS